MDKQIDAMDSSLRFDMVLDNVRKLKPGLQLRHAAERLDELTENLPVIHCDEYCTNPCYCDILRPLKVFCFAKNPRLRLGGRRL